MAKSEKSKEKSEALKPTAEDKQRADMLEKEGWSRPRRASGGEIYDWEKGKTVVGKLLQLKKLPDRGDDKGGTLMVLEVGGETQTWGCPTLLLETIRNVPIGTTLHIYCHGQVVPSRRGQLGWDFDVATRDQQKLGL